MPEILHESQGLRIHRNDLNGFVVIRLHYSADPAKRSPEWLAEARKGLDEARFLREYEIDYGSARGRKAFPEITHSASTIIVPPPYPEIPPPYYAGFDYGLRNPSAFLVFGWLNNILYCMWELYKPCHNLLSFVNEISACPYYPKIRWIAADPHIADKRFFRPDGSPASLLHQFQDQGITKIITSQTSEDAWLALMRQHWADPANPTFRIFERCTNTIREFSESVYDEPVTRTATLSERLLDANNHALDATKYYMLAQPKPVPTQTITPAYPSWSAKIRMR